MSNLNTKKSIAILITCYNRKLATLSCLQRLQQQKLRKDIQYQVFLLDDGSTDGTSEAVSQQYPDVEIINSEGNLYWNQGMRRAWKYAQEHGDFDYFLLLNDDTDLYDDAIMQLINIDEQLIQQTGKPGIIVGSIADPVDGHITYGGVVRVHNYIGIKFSLVTPNNTPQPCDTFNANCVLINKRIASDVGILSNKFTHGMGDTDYGLRAAKLGYKCLIPSGFVGTCANNAVSNTWLDEDLSLKERKKLLYSPKGRPPDEWLYFVKRHGGLVLCILAWAQLNMRLYFPKLWKILRKLRGRKD